MATYAIGDVQGCRRTLERLLRRIAFDPTRDRLWLVGDLVNRGPRSAEVLRWARGLGDSLVAVLGNHDLHLLARSLGVGRPSRRDTFDDVLHAPDAAELLGWLRRRPLAHGEAGYLLVHAGLAPSWSAATALAEAAELERALRGSEAADLLADLAAAPPIAWRAGLPPARRRIAALQVLTRLRTCRPSGLPCLGFSGPPAEAPPGCRPWFELRRADADATVLFGHWAALGLHFGRRAIALDSGCVWGRSLTALRLGDHTVFQEPLRDGTVRGRR